MSSPANVDDEGRRLDRIRRGRRSSSPRSEVSTTRISAGAGIGPHLHCWMTHYPTPCHLSGFRSVGSVRGLPLESVTLADMGSRSWEVSPPYVNLGAASCGCTGRAAQWVGRSVVERPLTSQRDERATLSRLECLSSVQSCI